MERHVGVDAARGARHWHALVLVSALLLYPSFNHSQEKAQAESNEVVRLLEARASRTADEEFRLGLAYAGVGRYAEAEEALLRGSRMKPRESRFYAELGGVSFAQKRYERAVEWLRKAEAIAPRDAYVNELLGTAMFLEGNVEAALKYWNRVGKPVLENVRVEPPLRLDAIVLDRAMAFAPGAVLTLEQWLATEARLRGLGIFPRFTLELVARDDEKYVVAVRATERNGFGSNKWEALLGTFGGVFYQTVTPAYYNASGTGTNISSLWRWDAERRRVEAEISGPMWRDPRWQYEAGVDLRNENWSVRNYSSIAGTELWSLNLRRSAGFARVKWAGSHRWSWATGGEWSYRDFRSVAFAPELLAEGHELKHFAEANYEVLRIPERRYVAATWASSELGRFWGGAGSTFEKVQGGVRQQWTASTKGDDLEMTHSLRLGWTFGKVPFDELYMLGLERDNDIPMRAHVGTRNGRKGNAPLGRRYVVSNWEFDKKVWSHGLISLKAGPFVDTGKIADPLEYLGTRKWLWDTGAQLKVRVLGVKVGVTYGRDLRAGKGALYAWIGK